jgi:hypothetical protein
MLDMRIGKLIAARKRVIRRELIINSRADADTPLRNVEYLCVGIDNCKRIRIDCSSIGNRAVSNRGTIPCQKERSRLT